MKKYYFAYGSNMLRSRLEARVGPVEKSGMAVLRNHVLEFHKRSKDGSTKANAMFTGIPYDIVVGVLYVLTDDQVKILDGFEGKGYDRNHVEVERIPENTKEQAFVYFANDITEGSPTKEYLDFILDGLRENEAPKEYIGLIEKTDFI